MVPTEKVEAASAASWNELCCKGPEDTWTHRSQTAHVLDTDDMARISHSKWVEALLDNGCKVERAVKVVLGKNATPDDVLGDNTKRFLFRLAEFLGRWQEENKY